MIYRYQKNKHAELLEKAAAILNEGGVALLPTETVYGLFVRADLEEAQQRLFDIKRRPESKILSLTLNSLEKIKKYARVEPWQELVLKQFLPGPVTFVLRSIKPVTRLVVTEEGTVGIRLPEHSFVQELISKTGPLASTSANVSGDASPVDFSDINPQIIEAVDFALNDGRCCIGIPSTVYDLTFNPGRVLREGAVKEEQIRRVIDAR